VTEPRTFPRERVRVTMTKEGDLRFLSHLDVVRVLKRAFTRGRVPAAMSQGFNPQIRLVFLAPLPVGVASRCEVFHFELDGPVDPGDVPRRLNEGLPAGLRVISAERDSHERPRHFECVFRVEKSGDPFPTEDQVAAFLASTSARVARRLGPSAPPSAAERTIDARPFVAGARLEPDGRALEVRIRTLDGRTVRADDALAAMAGEAARDAAGLVTKTAWRPIDDVEAAPLLAALPAASAPASAEAAAE